MYNILVIGSVNSTASIIKGLIKNGLSPVGILGYRPKNSEDVSGWVDLSKIASNKKIDYKSFVRINDEENLIWAMDKSPDIIFAVGFSQLLSENWLNLPTLGCVGFHPTALPKGRGRAPLAWLILNEEQGAATFFQMGKRADDGPIFVQKFFRVESSDTAATLEIKILDSIGLALDQWLPKLKKGEWKPIPQEELLATYYGKRTKSDGLIDWNQPSKIILKLIRAATNPHPGAYTYFNYRKIIIWEAVEEKNIKIRGAIGRILKIDRNKGLLIQCGKGLLWLVKTSEDINEYKIGQKFGMNLEDEVVKLWNKINEHE